MAKTCDYCREAGEDVKIVECVEKNSGPPFVIRACQTCRNLKGLSEWEPEGV